MEFAHERSISDGAKKAAEKRKSSSASIVENIQKSQRLTSGVLTKNSIHSLSDPRFLDPFRQRQKETAEREQAKMSKRKAKSNKLVNAVKKLREKYGHEKTHMFQPCDKNECGAYLQYKKQSTDQAMPKDLATRRQRCVEWMPRPSPMSTPYQGFQNKDEGENEAVQGLLGMAAMQASSGLLERKENKEDFGRGSVAEM